MGAIRFNFFGDGRWYLRKEKEEEEGQKGGLASTPKELISDSRRPSAILFLAFSSRRRIYKEGGKEKGAASARRGLSVVSR